MKVILAALGMVSVRVAGDDVVPERGLLQRDLVQFVGDLYGFAIRPNIPPNVPPQAFPILTFQQGRFVHTDGIFPIQQLVILQNGDLVAAANTDIAELVMNDYIEHLSSQLGFRYRDIPQTRYFSSTLVVEFDEGFGNRIAELQSIFEILTREMPSLGNVYYLRSVDFGYNDPLTTLTTPEDLDRVGFKIERRLGEPYNRNRFFCNAATKTSEHIRLLELIEATITKSK